MKRKMTILLFSLLLAVGWTSDAQAQVKTLESKPLQMSRRMVEKTLSPATNGHRMNAPLRANRGVDVPHVASWYANFRYTWTDAEGTHESSIVDPATKPEQIRALVSYIYETKEIPGTQFRAFSDITPYGGVDFGYYISSDVTEDITISMRRNVQIASITITDANDNEITSLTPGQTKSGWTVNNVTVYNGTTPYWYINASYGTTVYTAFTISKNFFTGKGTIKVKVNARSTQAHTPYGTLEDGTPYYQASSTHYTYWVNYVDGEGMHGPELTTSFADYITPVNSPISAPDDNGNTVLLVKLSNEVDYANTQAPGYTPSKDSLISYLRTYVTEVQLLTDGLRVGSETDNTAGTVFAYTGDLNRFYFIGKGKMAEISGSEIENYWFYADNNQRYIYADYYTDLAPFYNMYEEFSPTTVDEDVETTDFYEKMRQGTTYNIIHDCQSVNYMEHFFSMSGKEGTTENRVNSLVLYIPDDRGASGERNYDHQPTVGMYMVDLYADIEPSATQADYYTATVTWEDNLGNITHDSNVPQTYSLYRIMDEDGDGVMDTTMVYQGPNPYWTEDFEVGDPTAYDVHYFVVATPTNATNQDTFFAKSNTDDVTVPGKTDFVGLQWWRYESDYFAKKAADTEPNEVNYYRNWLAPHALSTSNQAGISAGNVGTTGRTLTLYREDTPIIDLELVTSGNKAYYRIKYRDRATNQQVEPGYNENTGEKNNN